MVNEIRASLVCTIERCARIAEENPDDAAKAIRRFLGQFLSSGTLGDVHYERLLLSNSKITAPRNRRVPSSK